MRDGEVMTVDEAFEAFYTVYPRHEGKKQARKNFLKLKPSDELLRRIVEDCKARYVGVPKHLIPHPGTYLNGARWEDEDKPADLIRAKLGMPVESASSPYMAQRRPVMVRPSDSEVKANLAKLRGIIRGI